MMRTLRKYMRHILWIVAASFILTIVFSWGMGGFKNRRNPAKSGIIGSVAGQKIHYQQFAKIYQQELDRVKQQSGDQEINEYQVQRIRDDVWNTLVQDILMSREIRRQHIQITPEEVVYYMRNNPPEFVKNHEQFQTDGKFDLNKYREALSDPRNYNAWIPVENYFKGLLPLQKLQQEIISTVRVSDGEALEYYKMNNEKVKVQYLFIDPEEFPANHKEITEDLIKKYYTAHEKDYEQPEMRKLQYIKFEIKPSREDTLQTLETAKYIINELHSGTDFAELAQDFSKDPGSVSKGGDLGFISKGTMVKPFEDAVFSAKVGSIIGPVETQFGLHVIEILARKIENGEPQVHARHILLKYETSSETNDDIREKAQSFYTELSENKKITFQSLADQKGYQIDETPLFRKGGFIPGIGMSSRISYLAFNNSVGWISEPARSGENLIVFRISEIQKSGFKPLADVKPAITRILEKQYQKEMAEKKASEIMGKIQSGVDFKMAAHENNQEINETDYFTLQGNVEKVGRDPKFSGTAFGLTPGEISQPVESNRGYYIIQLLDRTKIHESLFKAEKESIKQQLLEQKQQQIYTAWVKHLEESVKIEDYRDEYFY
jgi:peptidyl-prolyl cis-trans isomerase D